MYVLEIKKFTKVNRKVKKKKEALLSSKAPRGESRSEEGHFFIEEETFVPLV